MHRQIVGYNRTSGMFVNNCINNFVLSCFTLIYGFRKCEYDIESDCIQCVRSCINYDGRGYFILYNWDFIAYLFVLNYLLYLNF